MFGDEFRRFEPACQSDNDRGRSCRPSWRRYSINGLTSTTRSIPVATVDYAVVGSGEGTNQFLAGSVDFGASDAALTDEQIAGVKRGAVLVPVTAGCHRDSRTTRKGMPQSLKLPRDVYGDIFLGKIAHWNDPCVAAANSWRHTARDREIKVVAKRRDGSGTTFAFTNHLAAQQAKHGKKRSASERASFGPDISVWKNGNEGVSHSLKFDKGTIGYVEYGIAKRANPGMATLENKAGKIY